MILVVQDIHEISIEGMDIVQFGEILDDLGESVMHILLGVFHLSHVKTPYPRDFVPLVNYSGGLPLCLGQHYIDKVLKIKSVLF